MGAHTISLAASGDLEVSLRSGTLVFHKPIAYQESAHGRQAVESSFLLDSDDTAQFRLGRYDRNHELVIDPVFSLRLSGVVSSCVFFIRPSRVH